MQLSPEPLSARIEAATITGEAPAPAPHHRILLWLPALLIFACCLGRPVHDPDIWWHMRNGQWILAHRMVPQVDPYSFTAQGRPWVSQEWLWDVFAHGLWSAFGPLGLVAYTAIFLTGIYLLLCRLCWARCGDYVVASLTALFAMLAFTPTWSERPQLFTFLFTVISLFAIDRHLAGNRRALWPLVPLVTLWSNLHAGYFFGLVLLAVYTAGSFIWDRPKFRGFLTVLALCVAASLVNPNGINTLVYPLWIILNPPKITHITTDWMSPSLHQTSDQPVGVILLAVVAVLMYRKNRMRPVDAILLLVLYRMTLYSVRHVALLALVAAPILSVMLTSLFADKLSRDESKSSPLLQCGIAILALGYTLYGVQHLVRRPIEATSSDAALTYLDRHTLGPNLWTHFNIGGMAIGLLYPRYRVFIDGRSDFYGDKVFDDYTLIEQAWGPWRDVLRKYNVQTILCDRDAPLAQLLGKEGTWERVYSDKAKSVFARRGTFDPQAARQAEHAR
ncbi:MAG TPA: hypothetical protein VGM51_05615 [Armatimonadota bacterium]